DNTSFKLRTNNVQRMVLDSLGNAGIGTAPAFTTGTSQEKFLVDAGTTTSVNAIVGKGSIDSYLQLNIQNRYAGLNASSDVVATADNGSETTNFVDMGINSSVNTSGIMGDANDAYLYNIGQDFLMGTGTAAKSLIFMTGGTVQASNERMRIDGSGNVGIGTIAPSSKLHVSGTNPLTLNGVQTGLVSDSLLTIASGIVRKLPFASVASGTAWSLTGNTGTSSGTNFLGTTDNTSLKFRTNNTLGMVLDSLGNVGIGTSPAFTAGTFQEQLLVDAGTTSSYNAIVARGSINNYLQLNIQNQSNGTSASADIVATANNGNESTNYIDMGINSSTNSQNIMGAANDAYLYTTGNNLLVGTGTAAKSLVFMTGGTTQSTNERMRIDGSGNIGMGVTAPAQKLDINGNLKLSGAFMPAGDAGNAGEFLTSNGSGTAPVWINASPFLSSVAWVKAGNAGTTSVTDFIGTTDNKSFKIKTNNAQGFLLDSLGNVAIGVSPALTAGTFREKFLVDAGITSSYNAIIGRGSINNYLQLNIQNLSNGGNASSDVVATSDDGNETDNFIDMGINSSANTQGIMGGASDAYLYTSGNNLLIGTGTAAKSLIFMTGGTAQGTNERMRIDGNGKMGIGVTGPTAMLHLKAGTTTASTAPLKFTSGTNMTTAENGAMEFDGTNYFATSGGVRYTLAKTLTATATLNFPSTGAGASSALTVTVTGAADGDIVQLGVPNGSINSNCVYDAYVSSANTVTVKFNNNGGFFGVDPASGTFRVAIIKY
ncbi:MAG TPA: hypothetical protein VK645_15140, partial [Chitinophagaceae bacterium]|nr:hypothetical protein [Chitinophagaceae bacterium]